MLWSAQSRGEKGDKKCFMLVCVPSIGYKMRAMCRVSQSEGVEQVQHSYGATGFAIPPSPGLHLGYGLPRMDLGVALRGESPHYLKGPRCVGVTLRKEI
jgi:hypothetical protein